MTHSSRLPEPRKPVQVVGAGPHANARGVEALFEKSSSRIVRLALSPTSVPAIPIDGALGQLMKDRENSLSDRRLPVLVRVYELLAKLVGDVGYRHI